MKLKELSIKGFRCFKDSGVIPFHDLSVFIGENDAGKTTVLDALDILLNNISPKNDSERGICDYRSDCSCIEIEGTFLVESPADNIKKYLIGNDFKIKKIFLKTDQILKVEINMEVFEDDRFNTFDSFGPSELKSFLSVLYLQAKANQEERKESIIKYISENTLTKVHKWKEYKISEVSHLLPIYQRYSSHDYGNPEGLIKKTLDLVYRSHFYTKNGEGVEVLKDDFSVLKTTILGDINDKLESDLLEHVKKHKNDVEKVGAICDIDFTRGLSFSGLNITDTTGESRSITQYGQGTKKKIFLSIIEWDFDVYVKTQSKENIIRGYDEPDVNLHYDAQRKMFYVINELTKNTHISTQAIICTHSLSMIDRAPAGCINQVIKDGGTENSTINYLKTDDDTDISTFLSQIAEISGIKNSSIFYEKCFLLVEGESEQNALPIMYKKCIGRSMSEDGLVLINLQTNGQWNNALKFLHANKSKCTVMLLDSDIQYVSSTNQVTKEKLNNIGFDTGFLSNNCFFIGTKEFEDVISDKQYENICNSKFPKFDGSVWCEKDFTDIRGADKFSESLRVLICKETKKRIGKPEIASETAEVLIKNEVESIVKIKALFDKVQEIIE